MEMQVGFEMWRMAEARAGDLGGWWASSLQLAGTCGGGSRDFDVLRIAIGQLRANGQTMGGLVVGCTVVCRRKLRVIIEFR